MLAEEKLAILQTRDLRLRQRIGGPGSNNTLSLSAFGWVQLSVGRTLQAFGFHPVAKSFVRKRDSFCDSFDRSIGSIP